MGTLTVLLVLTCGTVVTAGVPQAATPVKITLERTACYGRCPVYEVTVDDTGRVTYNGHQYVRVSGRRTAMIDRAAVAKLVADIERAGFFELKNSYEAMVTDNPTVFVTVEIGDRKKRVRDYVAGPRVLRELQREIDRVTNSRRWVSLDPETLAEIQRSTAPFDKKRLTTELTAALRRGHLDTAGALIAAGADVDGGDGANPLIQAVSAGAADRVMLLLAAGANPLAKDRNGRAVLEFATKLEIGCLSHVAFIARTPSMANRAEREVTADDCRTIAGLITAAIAKRGGK